MGNSSSSDECDLRTDRKEIYEALTKIENFACSAPTHCVYEGGKVGCCTHKFAKEECFEAIAKRDVTKAADVKERILKEAAEKKAEEEKVKSTS